MLRKPLTPFVSAFLLAAILGVCVPQAHAAGEPAGDSPWAEAWAAMKATAALLWPQPSKAPQAAADEPSEEPEASAHLDPAG